MVSGVVEPRTWIRSWITDGYARCVAGMRGGGDFHEHDEVIVVVWESRERAGTGPDAAMRAQLWADIQANAWNDEEFDEEEFPRAVRRGEEADMVAAFAQAQHDATVLWQMLCRLGLGGEVISLAATLSMDNRPITRLRMTPTGGRLLRQLIAGGPAPPALHAG